jgi:hypothetical protein
MGSLGKPGSAAAWQRIALAAVIVAALLLRVGVALYNAEANDDHMEVVELIVDRGADPVVGDCWQCCHAKLFHRSAAVVITALSIEDPRARARAAQLLNVAAGALTLWLLWAMAGTLSLPFGLRLTGFALFALNPRLVGVNGQPSNDSFVILFGTASIYCLWRYLETSSPRYMAATIAALILASLSKTQGVVLFAITATVLLAKVVASYSNPARRRSLGLALLGLTVVYLGTVPFLGPYYQHYRLEGSPFAWNTSKVEPPAFFRKTEIRRAGVRSIADAYFTFRLVDLLRDPVIRRKNYGEHRTSMWSTLYARSQFVHFDDWPPSWRTRDPTVRNAGRAALVLGLVPLTILLVSTAREVVRLLRGLGERGLRWLADDHRWVLPAFAGGMLFIVVKLSYDFRDYSAYKAIYFYPGLAAFLVLFLWGLQWVDARLLERRRLRASLFAAMAVLIPIYCADLLWLIDQLR